MIALQRIRTIKVIPAKYRGSSKMTKDKELLLAQRTFLNDAKKPVIFNSTFWTAAKDQLKVESNGKCAYCEANTEVVAHGDVEHYRPKSVYWWLAYTYDNYLYACQICNQTYKGVNFPVGAKMFTAPGVKKTSTDASIDKLVGNISPDPVDLKSKYPLSRFLTNHKKEKAYLINPYFEKPQDFYAYAADDMLKEVKIVPTKPEYAPYIKAAEDYYGINRIELKNLRYSTFSKFRAFKMAFGALTDVGIKQEIKNQLDDMKSDGYLFAGMNRYFDGKL
ncbi:MAG: hypothetical protein ABI378_06760 [Chitinophagaceae bacterium]